MTPLTNFSVVEIDVAKLDQFEGQILIFAADSNSFDVVSRKINGLTNGALERFLGSEEFEKLGNGKVYTLSFPTGLAAQSLLIAKISLNTSIAEARSCGVEICKSAAGVKLLLAAGHFKRLADLAEGIGLRNYEYLDQKTNATPKPLNVTIMVKNVSMQSSSIAAKMAVVDGVFFTRDLVNAPANVLTTTTFSEQLIKLSELGIDVQVLDEPELEELGMRALLCVGQGSSSPSKVVVMRWNGGGDEAPFALVGKGVVFDTGGISLKPAGGMENMTMDMGGAGVVAGTMKALALRNAAANVVGVVGLVENMPSGNATRPGDVVKSMKGDTIEVINTDAEGRLVLADILWYTQERFNPTGIIDLATLTGAIIVGLGHEMAGVFSNSDTLTKHFINAAVAEGEGAWRMPLAPAYDEQLKSRIADMKNVGTRSAGSITAGQFLQRFVKSDMPWAHLDIAGVASIDASSAFSPKGATGWGVRALIRMIADHYETKEELAG